MSTEKKIIDYLELKKLFDEEYKKTAALIRDGEEHLDNLAEGFYEADRVIFRLPTVDAVEVVRCKDCKHRCSGEYCECRPEDGFCNDGERAPR